MKQLVPQHGITRRVVLRGFAASCLTSFHLACDKPKAVGTEVVLYTAVDEPVARPIIQAFEQQTGLKVILKTDTEATKTAGLSERLQAEKSRPQADVWWSNEVFHTINLAASGVLQPYASPAASAIPDLFKETSYLWAGTALRARVIAVSTADDKLPARMTSINDLLDPALKDRIVMARPSAGTTAGHVAALYTLWGKETADIYFKGLAANGLKLVGGNSVVAEQVGQGHMLAGLTDNDDIDSMLRAGGKLKGILPDQGADQIGTLMIPCTVGLVKDGPNPENARKLIDYLLSKEVEAKLIERKFAGFSVFPGGSSSAKAMNVDYAAVAANMKSSIESALKILEDRK